MSFCRFSDDDYQCDVYSYESVHSGFVTHVAENRPVITEELPPKVGLDDIEAWMARHEKVMALMKNAERTRIGLPHDGESFDDPTLVDLLERLIYLKDIGYNVPEWALDSIREELAEDHPNA